MGRDDKEVVNISIMSPMFPAGLGKLNKIWSSRELFSEEEIEMFQKDIKYLERELKYIIDKINELKK